MEDNGSRDWSIYLTGFPAGAIEKSLPGALEVSESSAVDNYIVLVLGEETKTRLKVSVHAEVIEEGE